MLVNVCMLAAFCMLSAQAVNLRIKRPQSCHQTNWSSWNKNVRELIKRRVPKTRIQLIFSLQLCIFIFIKRQHWAVLKKILKTQFMNIETKFWKQCEMFSFANWNIICHCQDKQSPCQLKQTLRRLYLNFLQRYNFKWWVSWCWKQSFVCHILERKKRRSRVRWFDFMLEIYSRL